MANITLTMTLKMSIADDEDISEAMQPHLEKVAELVANGYQEGELFDGSARGWWKLVETRDEVQS